MLTKARCIFLGISICGLAALLVAGKQYDEKAHPSSRLAVLPRVTLWAWERPESLADVNPRTTAVAYLDGTIYLTSSGGVFRPRTAPLVLAQGTPRIAVVRIESSVDPEALEDQLDSTIRELVRVANQPGISALQIDFDARRSERAFYRNLLFRLHAELPPSLPLSITALASWCGADNWIHNLPIDEAVPMFFRMEPALRNEHFSSSGIPIREPLCRNTAGVSTESHWPALSFHQRIYVFPDHGWHPKTLQEVALKLQ